MLQFTDNNSVVVLLLFIPLLFMVLLFSYVWTDLAIVLMLGETRPFIFQLNQFRDLLGPNRLLFANIFLMFILLATILQIGLLFSKKKVDRKWIPLIIISLLIASLSYPFLSYDIFGYLFAAKIAYVYHLNPYTVIPETFRNIDLWVGFTYWTHRAYVYGPFYLLYSAVPIIISSGRQFLVAFFGMKVMNVLLFLTSGYLLLKKTDNKPKVLAYWFFNPLLIFELLINSHNEVVMISLFVIASVLIMNKKIWGWVIFLLSVLTKYLSGGLFIGLILNKKYSEFFYKLAVIGILFYLGITLPNVQGWYYTWIYMALPFASVSIISLLSIFIFQFLLLWVKYYPFILTGGWNQISIQPYVRVLSILLPILLIILEYKNIYGPLKDLVINHSSIIKKSPNN